MKNLTYFFQYNIPAANHATGRKDDFINVLAEWDGHTEYSEEKIPLVIVNPVNMSFYDVLKVDNWMLAHKQIKNIAERHFKSLSKELAKENAHKLLSEENNPVLSRLNEVKSNCAIEHY